MKLCIWLSNYWRALVICRYCALVLLLSFTSKLFSSREDASPKMFSLGVLPGTFPDRGLNHKKDVDRRRTISGIVVAAKQPAHGRFLSDVNKIANDSEQFSGRHVSINHVYGAAVDSIQGKQSVSSLGTNQATMELWSRQKSLPEEDLRSKEQKESRDLPVLPQFPEPPVSEESKQETTKARFLCCWRDKGNRK